MYSDDTDGVDGEGPDTTHRNGAETIRPRVLTGIGVLARSNTIRFVSETIPRGLAGGLSVRNRPADERPGGRRRRVAESVAGGVLLTAGLRRRSLGGAAMALGGGWLIARGISGTRRPLRAIASMASGTRSRTEPGVPADAVTAERSITVGAPADELGGYWRDPEQLTRIMGSFAEVTGAGADRHRWNVTLPRGPDLTWETKLVDDEPGERLRWVSLSGATIPIEGDVRFRPAPGDRGTTVTLRLTFDPPGGELGDAVFRRLGILPETVAEKALRRFKSLVETGEIPSLERNPSARGSGDLL